MLIRCGLISFMVMLLLAACAPPRGVYHTVQKGQTLYQIARTYQIDPERISSINRIADPTRLAIGDRLFIPGAGQVKSVKATVIGPAPAPAPVKAKIVSAVKTPSTRQPPVVQTSPKTTYAKPKVKPQSTLQSTPAAAKKGVLQWPVKGEVVKSFRSGPQSSTANGIEIAVRDGSPIQSAAAGKVIYSGNGIPGYGNLIIVQHDHALYSVYGFNRKNLVTAGTFVSQGQKIALSGIPPGGGVPRLYFEARSGKNPVNPIFYLP